MSTHILVFHLIAWKMFFALQPDDWFVRLLKLPIQELDDTTRSRNSMIIGTVLMGFLIRRFGVLMTYAFGSNIFTALMINYAMRKYFIFNG